MLHQFIGAPNTQPPASPAKSESGKRKGRNSECDVAEPTAKKGRAASRNGPATPASPQPLIECPEPNCGKKYKQMNGLKYHRRNAHNDTCNGSDSMSDTEKPDLPSADEETKKKKRKVKGLNKSQAMMSAEKKPAVKTEPEEKEVKTEAADLKPPELISNHTNTTSVITATTNQAPIMSQQSAVPVATITPQVVKPTSQASDEKEQGRPSGLSASTSRPLPITPKLLPKSGSNSMAPISTITSQGIYNSALKPIQPKPTILGEATPNPGLNDLRDHKKLKRKRSASRDELLTCGSSSPVLETQKGSRDSDARLAPNQLPPGDAANLLKSPSSYSDISDDGEVRNAASRRDLQSAPPLYPPAAHLVATVSPQKNSPNAERQKTSTAAVSASSGSKLEERRKHADDIKQQEIDMYKQLSAHYPINIHQWHPNMQQEAFQRLMGREKRRQSPSPKSGPRKSSPAPPARELDSKASNERYQLLKENMDMKNHHVPQAATSAAAEMPHDYSMPSTNQRLPDDASKFFSMYQDPKQQDREHQKREFMHMQAAAKASSTKMENKNDPSRSVSQSSAMPPPSNFVPQMLNPLLSFSTPLPHPMNLMPGFPMVDLAGMKELAARPGSSSLYPGKSDHKIHELERPSKSPRPLVNPDRLQVSKSGMVLPPAASALPHMFGYNTPGKVNSKYLSHLANHHDASLTQTFVFYRVSCHRPFGVLQSHQQIKADGRILYSTLGVPSLCIS